MGPKIVPLDRAAAIDFSEANEIMLSIDPYKARRNGGELPEELASILARLIMGKPVRKRDMATWGVHAMRVYDIDDMAAGRIPGVPAAAPLEHPSKPD